MLGIPRAVTPHRTGTAINMLLDVAIACTARISAAMNHRSNSLFTAPFSRGMAGSVPATAPW